jgi:hypothetical protein
LRWVTLGKKGGNLAEHAHSNDMTNHSGVIGEIGGGVGLNSLSVSLSLIRLMKFLHNNNYAMYELHATDYSVSGPPLSNNGLAIHLCMFLTLTQECREGS